MDLGGRIWYHSKCRPTFPFDFYTHDRPILHRLATIHDAADRKTDRAMAIGHLYYSIGGLQIVSRPTKTKIRRRATDAPK